MLKSCHRAFLKVRSKEPDQISPGNILKNNKRAAMKWPGDHQEVAPGENAE